MFRLCHWEKKVKKKKKYHENKPSDQYSFNVQVWTGEMIRYQPDSVVTKPNNKSSNRVTAASVQ